MTLGWPWPILRQGQIWSLMLLYGKKVKQRIFRKLLSSMIWSVRVAERLALPTSVHRVAGSNPTGGEILPEPKRRFIAQSLSCSPFHRLEMTEILLKGRKILTHPSIICDLKLATDDRSDTKFLLTSKLCPLGAVCPLPWGYIHVLNHEKNV